MAKLYIPTLLRKLSDQQSMLTLAGGTVGELLATYDDRCPGVKDQLFDGQGQLKQHIAIFVNDTDIRSLDGMNTVVDDRDEVQILPAIAGGAS